MPLIAWGLVSIGTAATAYFGKEALTELNKTALFGIAGFALYKVLK